MLVNRSKVRGEWLRFLVVRDLVVGYRCMIESVGLDCSTIYSSFRRFVVRLAPSPFYCLVIRMEVGWPLMKIVFNA